MYDARFQLELVLHLAQPAHRAALVRIVVARLGGQVRHQHPVPQRKAGGLGLAGDARKIPEGAQPRLARVEGGCDGANPGQDRLPAPRELVLIQPAVHHDAAVVVVLEIGPDEHPRRPA